MNVPTNVAAIVWMVPRVINRLVFVIEGAAQGTFTVTAAQVSDDNYCLQILIQIYIYKHDGHKL